MTHYLIEFRFQGKARSELKRLIWDVDKKWSLGRADKKRPVPHISLVSPFTTENEQRLIRDFYNICSGNPVMNFSVRGFNTFEENRVMYVDIHPGKQLEKFRWHLSKKLRSYCDLKPIDCKRKYYFHSTIAFKLSPQKFQQVKSYIQSKSRPDFRHAVVRITLLRNSSILREYDFMQRKMFDRQGAINRAVYRRTMELLKRYFEGTYRPDDKIKSLFWNRIKTLLGGWSALGSGLKIGVGFAFRRGGSELGSGLIIPDLNFQVRPQNHSIKKMSALSVMACPLWRCSLPGGRKSPSPFS